MQVYRGKLRAALMAALDEGRMRLPADTTEAKLRGTFNKIGRLTLNVKMLPRYSSGRGVLTYLARYLRGGPINNKRLISVDSSNVRFHYHDYRDGKRKQMSLPTDQFIRRFLLHVPPPRMQVVRSFGLYASRKRDDLDRCHELLGIPEATAEAEVSWEALLERLGHAVESHCGICGEELVREKIPPQIRPPPVPLSGLLADQNYIAKVVQQKTSAEGLRPHLVLASGGQLLDNEMSAFTPHLR